MKKRRMQRVEGTERCRSATLRQSSKASDTGNRMQPCWTFHCAAHCGRGSYVP